MTPRESSRTTRAYLVVPLVLLWLAGASLRLPVLALPPVLAEVTTHFRLRPTDVGVLTATPSFFFAVAAIPAAMAVGRIGALACLLLGLVVDFVGGVARGFAVSTATLEIATAVMSLGIAVMQPVMPVLVRAWAPGRIGLASATYTFGLLFGEIVPVTWPVRLPAFGSNGTWRSQLVAWSLPVAATAVAIAVRRLPASRTGAGASPWPDWSRRDVWWIGSLMGAVGAVYFALNGFIPGWLNRAGAGGSVGAALTALNAAQLPAALLMLAYAERLAFRAWAYVVAGAALLASSAVLALGPGAAAVAAAAVAGFCLAIALALVLTLQPLVADDETLPALSAGTFTIGFGIAVVVALLTGWLERLGATAPSVVPIAAAALAIVAFGATISRVRPRA